MNIDTLSIARDLRAADLPSGQAEAIAAAIGRAVVESSATKADLALAVAGVEAKIEQVRAEVGQVRKEVTSVEHKLEAKIESAQTKLIMWFVGTQLAFVALIGAILKL